MPIQHASDLSPAQRLLWETHTLHQRLEVKTDEQVQATHILAIDSADSLEEYFECGPEIRACQIQAVQNLFIDVLDWCAKRADHGSWQSRRLQALMGPMYLEVATILEPQDSCSHPRELLSVYTTWSIAKLCCEICHDAQQRALTELIELLSEMITEI